MSNPQMITMRRYAIASLSYSMIPVALALFLITAPYMMTTLPWPAVIGLEISLILCAAKGYQIAASALCLMLALATIQGIWGNVPSLANSSIEAQSGILALYVLSFVSPLATLALGTQAAEWSMPAPKPQPQAVANPPKPPRPREKLRSRRATGTKPNVNGYVYMIQSLTDPPHYKIGKSKHRQKRIRSLGVVLPFEIEIIHIIECNDRHAAEKFWHHHFKACRVDGEWFDLNESQIAEFRATKTM